MSKIIQFIKEVKAEFKNITWPKKDTLFQLTIVVISISIVISLILGSFDFLFINFFKFLSNTKNQIPILHQEVKETSIPKIEIPEESDNPQKIELDVQNE